MNWKDNDSPVTWAPVLLIVGLLGCMGLGILYVGMNDLQAAWASQTWPKVQGRVVSYSVEQRKSTDSDNRERTYTYPHIVYRYEVNGQSYTGDRITFGDAGGSGPSLPYRAEDAVTVYYSPVDPSTAVLHPGESATPLPVLGAGVCFAVFGVPLTLLILARILRWLIVGLLGRNRAAA